MGFTMFYHVEGICAHKDQQFVVIDCGGVGYQVYTSLQTMSRMGEVGSKAKLYTYLYLRENIMDLYGFHDLEELNCFKMLISISGVGSKMAIALLSVLTAGQFAMCVVTQDVKAISQVSGIGPKRAQRIVLELKDKIKNEQLAAPDSLDPVLPVFEGGARGEALNALMVLGYTKSEGQRAISQIPDMEMSLEDLIKEALKRLMR